MRIFKEDEDVMVTLPDDEDVPTGITYEEPEHTEAEVDSNGDTVLVQAEATEDIEEKLLDKPIEDVELPAEEIEAAEEALEDEEVMMESGDIVDIISDDEELPEENVTTADIEAAMDSSSDIETAGEAVEELLGEEPSEEDTADDVEL